MSETRTQFDFSLLALGQKYTIPDGWEVFGWERVNLDTPNEVIVYTGAVARETYKRGPRKGRTNWGKRDRSTEMKLSITPREFEAFLAQWSRETGLCEKCHGNGTAWAGWSADEGNHYVHCKKCDGSGKAMLAAREATNG